MMEVFVNERSLYGQFVDIADVAAAVIVVNGILARILECPSERRVYLDSRIFLKPVMMVKNFSSCLEHLPDKDARLQFKRLLRERLNALDWTAEQLQDAGPYCWDGEDVTDSSVAELAERSLRQGVGFLLNFAPSKFPSGLCVEVEKNGMEAIVLGSVNSLVDLEAWCKCHPELGLVAYDEGCGRTPLDQETVLRDRGRFVQTNLKNHGRRVYLERRTGYYMCVDNLHEHGAHLEVFDANCIHIGEADLDGVIDRSKADPSKYLAR